MQNTRLLNDKTSKWIAYLLPWIQWLHIYEFFAGLTLGYVLIILVDLYFIFYSIKVGVLKVSRKDYFLILFAIFVLLSFPVAILLESESLMFSIMKRTIQMIILYVTIVFANSGRIDWKAYVKSLAVLTFFSCGVLIAQFLMQTFTGQYFNFKLPFLKYSTTEANDRLLSGVTTGSRYRSIFTEPSHFIFFAFQYLVVVMFGEDRRSFKSIFSIVLISACVLLSASSTGLILLIVVWAVYMLLFYKGRKLTVGSVLLGVFVFAILLVGIYIYINDEDLSFSFMRMTSEYERSTTVWKRLYANFEDVQAMQGISVLIGHGLGNVQDEFMNSIVYMLLNVGYIGLFIMIAWLISYFLQSNLRGKLAIIVLVMLAAIDLVLFTPTVMGYVIIAAYSPKDKLQKAEKSGLRKG